MAHTLSITDGTTTITLTSGNQYLSHYVPETAVNGEDLRETLTVGFTGATINDAISTIRSLSALFEQARRWGQYKTGARVFVNFDPGATGTAYRSLLRGGNIDLNEKTLKEHWGARNLELKIDWIRQGFWEGPETAISMTSFATALNTTVTVNNKSDTDMGNYVTIASTDITLGDLPAPMKLTITNAQPTSDSYGSIYEAYVFHNVDSNPTTFNHWIEAESSSDVVAPTTDIYSSNYAYCTKSWSTDVDELMLRWTVANTQVDAMAGGRFAVFAIISSAGTTDASAKYFSVKINAPQYSGYLYSGGKTQWGVSTTYPWYIDTIRVPPSLQATTTFSSLFLELWAYSPTTNIHTFGLDALFVAPISADNGWMKIAHVSGNGFGAAYNEKIVVNEYDDLLYHEVSNQKIAAFGMYGGPIMLVPNKTQRLYFLCSVPTAYVRFQSMSINISYRPRYRAL